MVAHTVIDTLKSRGLIEQITDEEAIRQEVGKPNGRVYVGFDPTATSLHVGTLVPIIALMHIQQAGLTPICVVGGATGMIGDPSGRNSERVLMTTDLVAENVRGIQHQLSQFLDFSGPHAALMVNNYDWTSPISYIDWLRDIGKHFTVNYMMAKESVKQRLEDRDQGISYTEFSYMLLQAYDFLHLFEHQGCTMQGGGNDQWGNITAGIELIRRVRGQQAYGFTFPLVTTASGEKFGKSAGNAIWLDAQMTSPYQFYQFWIRTDDQDVENHLKLFTFLDLNEISTCCQAHQTAPERREAQRLLATEVTRLVHGEEGLAKAQRASEVLFGKEIQQLSDKDLGEIFADVPATEKKQSDLDNSLKLSDLLKESGLCASNSEARRALQAGSVYINNRREADPNKCVTAADLASESTLVLRLGKKQYHLVRFISA